MSQLLLFPESESRRPSRRALRLAAAALLAAIAALHLVTAPDHFDEAAWLGALFICTVVGACLSAIVMLAGRAIAWIAGAMIAFSTALGFLLAATTGLGPVHETFQENLGVPALIIEAAFLAIAGCRALLRVRQRSVSADAQAVIGRDAGGGDAQQQPRRPAA
jgi:peptidoglycan/LPS O-acetylase OafA/YrhL